ncbi:MAG: hypothetical protein K9L64_07320 [Candidatus Izimaplasma sp.]|nr:hypothetical protein [Candidatus Izimaplasma bacterium]
MKQLLWIILQVNMTTIFYFVIGVLTGFVLLFLVFVLIATINEKKRYKKRILNKLPLGDKEVYELIEEKQSQLLETVRLTDNAYFRVSFDLSYELMEEIASHYFPEAKYPMYEITVEELLELNRYITKRIEEMVNGKFLKHFKNFRISSLINLLHMKKVIDDSKLMRLNRKFKLSKFYNMGRTVVNYANPVFWFRRLAIKPTTEVATKEICKYIIAVVGEETNNIYSKSFAEHRDDEVELEEKFNELIEGE